MLCPIHLKKNITSENIKVSENSFTCQKEFCTHFLDSKTFKTNHKDENCNIIKKLSEEYSIINWFNLSVFSRAHSKIICFLILHIDSFQLNNDKFLKEIKQDYYSINKLANLFKLELVKSLSFNFISKLSSFYKSVFTKEEFERNIDYQILKSINNYLINIKSKERVLCKYTIHFHCKSCNFLYSQSHCDYILTLPCDKSYFHISKKGISYRIACEKCSKRTEVKITIQNIPKFLIIHNENGSRENVKRFQTGFNLRNDLFPLIGVIECKDNFQGEIVNSNCQMGFQKYLTITWCDKRRRMTTGDSSDDYVVHFRHQNGWFSMSENRPLLCRPTYSINSTSGLSARFLIYGKPSTTQLLDKHFDLKEFLHKFELENSIDLNPFLLNQEEWRMNNPQTECSNPIIKLERLDLSKFRYETEKDCYIVPSVCKARSLSIDGSESDSVSVDSESVSSKTVSIHSQSTVSEFSTDSDEDWVDAYWDSIQKSDKSRIDPISSSGFSSASSSVIAPSTRKAPTHTNSSNYSDFFSDSSVSSFDSSSRKRKVNIDHLIKIKRSRI